MAFTPISNTIPQYYAAGVPAISHYIKFYIANTTTPIFHYTDRSGAVSQLAARIDSEGYPLNPSSARFIPHVDQAYKIALFTSLAAATANDFMQTVWVIDDLDPVETFSVASSDQILVFDNVAELVAETGLNVGDVVETKGYFTNNDGGQARYLIVAGGTAADDGGSYHDLASGLQAELAFSGSVKIEVFGAKGDGVSDDTNPLTSAFNKSDIATIVFGAGKIYLTDDDIILKSGSSINATGATIRLTDEQKGGIGPGHFVGINGDKTDISNPIPLTDIKWVGGIVDVNLFAGVNGFGIEVAENVLIENCKAINCRHDNPTEGGRGFTAHPRSRNISLVNCWADDCDHGFDISTKSDNLISNTITGATSANPIVITSTAHPFTNGQTVYIQQMSGDFGALNAREFIAANVTANTFELTGEDGTAFGAYVSNGVASLGDEDEQHVRNYSLHNCRATDCSISAFTGFQANNSRSMNLNASDIFVNGFKAVNCGTQFSSEWGIINVSALVGMQGDFQIYNDSDNPVGAVFRGSFHKCNISALVDVHTCSELIDATPLVGVSGLDAGISSFPEGTLTENKFQIIFNNETLSNAFINTDDVTGSIRDIYRNEFNIIYTRVDNLGTDPFSGTLVSNANHFTNHGTFYDVVSGARLSFFFDEPLTFNTPGQSFNKLAVDGVSSARAEFDLNIRGTAASARINALNDGAIDGYLDYSPSVKEWAMFVNAVAVWEWTATDYKPRTDNLINVGSAGLRVKEYFGVAGSINTSDEREKTALGSLSDKEKACAVELKGSIYKYKWIDSEKEKGEQARIHFGIGAQTVEGIFIKHGLNAEQYGLFCYDEWEEKKDSDGALILEAGNRYGLRYSELTCFILAAL